MNRREFLKGTLSVAALAPLAKLSAKAGADGNKSSDLAKGPQVTRRRYRDTAMTLPMLGFGMMRLPTLGPGNSRIDYATVEKQIARALEAGVNYFDTAYFYHGGASETCVGDVLSKFPRDSYYLASKMPVRMVRSEADVKRIFEEQLKKCKTPYFDFYLLHNLNQGRWKDAIQFKVYEYLLEQKKQGRIRKLGFSFHDKPEVLETIAKAHPWDFAQIQLNYLDWTMYRSKEQYEILVKYNIPAVIMEPLKGGALARLNPETEEVFRKADPKASVASWAFRYVGSLPNVLCILSGMTLMEHLEDNIRTFTDFKPLTDPERAVITQALAAYRKTKLIPCTNCRYCMPCPVGVNIPRNFEIFNQFRISGRVQRFPMDYNSIPEDQRASECVACGACLKKCPQKINIPAELKKIAAEAEKLRTRTRGRRRNAMNLMTDPDEFELV